MRSRLFSKHLLCYGCSRFTVRTKWYLDKQQVPGYKGRPEALCRTKCVPTDHLKGDTWITGRATNQHTTWLSTTNRGPAQSSRRCCWVITSRGLCWRQMVHKASTTGRALHEYVREQTSSNTAKRLTLWSRVNRTSEKPLASGESSTCGVTQNDNP